MTAASGSPVVPSDSTVTPMNMAGESPVVPSDSTVTPMNMAGEAGDSLANTITDADVAACLRVLEQCNSNIELLQQDKRLRMVRKQTRWIANKLSKNDFNGVNKTEYKRRKRDKQTKLSIMHRQKAADRKHIRSTRLRSERLKALEKLTHGPQTDNLAVLMDSPQNLDDHNSGPHLLTDGGISQNQKLSDNVAISDVNDHDKQIAQENQVRQLNYPRSCYTCKTRYTHLHHWYDQLCPVCAELNWKKRNQTADLNGKVVLLTGSRVKIGFECGLKLLRCGALLIATTRFPHDAARRYAKQPDFSAWKDRLHVYGVDLRDLKSVMRFCEIIKQRYHRLDAIVNNAAQTIRRPPAYYKHLIPTEMTPTDQLPENIPRKVIKADPHQAHEVPEYIRLCGAPKPSTPTTKPDISEVDVSTESSSSMPKVEEPGEQLPPPVQPLKHDVAVMDSVMHAMASNNPVAKISAVLSQAVVAQGDDVFDEKLFPTGKFDVTGQQLDLRRDNSWTALLHQVDPAELLEVFAINALAPFIINSRLKPLMTVSANKDENKYVINVSAMEGKFYRFKSAKHPHTNMAKAALNMMTRTSGQDYATSRIYMNSVDTGWINDENPHHTAQRLAKKHDFQTPIDETDAMARILDPILDGFNGGNNPFGKFFKDFQETEW